MSFTVRWTVEALEDLDELYGFLLERNVPAAGKALAAIRKGVEMLEHFPSSCRVVARRGDSVLREVVISFGRRGYVALFEIDDESTVTILALRHQRESDFH